MATWDGSYHGPEDPNYFLYANPNASGTTTDNWNYFSGNGTNGFLQNGSNFYPQNEPMMYEQNAPGSYYQMDSHVPSVPSNLVPLGNTYQEHVVANAVGNTQIPSNSQCFYENNKTAKNSAPFHYENNYKKKSRGNKSNRHTYSQTNNDNQLKIAEQSNLHATASEFVPNDVKLNEKKPKTNDPNCSGEFGSKSSRSCDTVSVDGRNKHDRNYDYKKSKNYKKKESEDSYSQIGGGYKNYKAQNIRSYSTSRNDKYFNNKYYSDKSLGKMRKSSTPDARASSSSSNAYESGFVGINQEEQQSSSTNSNISKNEEVTSDISNQESTSARNSNKSRRFNTRSNEFWNTKYNSSPDQSQVPNKNTRKHSSNRNNRYENDYKEKRNSYQDYGTYRDSYNKENKSERFKEKENKDAMPENREKVVENWRQRSQNSEQNRGGKKWMQNKKHEAADDVSQRERLSDQLNRGQLECLVCCEYIKQTDYVWSCSNCYHVLHLKCVKKWAKSSQADNGWRCPACQNVSSVIPEEYLCFCGKTKTPEWNRRDTAHSCAEVCGRTLSKNNCIHKCTLLCHPGSCPPCITMVSKYCGCGKTSQILQCSSSTLLLCDAVCGKDLNCGKHTCEKKCHHGECGPCEKSLTQECYCGKNTRDVTCDADIPVTYSCGNACDKLLECGNHNCKILCHPDDCEPCSLTPDKITTCCCGQTLLTEKRDSCQDPVPTCDKTCSKRLRCGQPSNPHTCKVNCHEGDCPECELTTDVKCRCGNMDREIACKDLRTKADDARCEKRCTKKRSCGKHKCNQLCCIDIEHICPLRCSKTLSCGRHKCELTCHKGRCQPCWRRSFDELYCECGNAVILPPVPCGTRRPTCDKPCTREHACGHEVLHNCHSESTCPPCTVLTQRWCHGKHELRKAVPCHVSEISCGLPCNKPLSCGRHKCITICHPGCCEKPGQQCIQPCTTPRELCGHICAAPCHDDRCPDTPCKEMVKVTCQCGHRSTTRVCAENSREYQRIASSILASKMADMQLGHSVDLDEVFGQGAKKQNQLKTLECNDECKLIERNRRLALGLQIVNPDLSGKLMPRYSTFMKQWAKKDPHFCQMVHDKLTELVQLAKTSKQKSRSYSFDSMNREKRYFVHESCEHFGCESQAYDQEPKRNVVATAVKDKCWLPSYSLLEIVQRENGQRKVPGPMLNTSKGTSSVKTVLSLPVKQSPKTVATSSISKSPEPEIDYFDYQG